MAGPALQGQIGQNFAQHGGEFESMAGEPGGDDHLIMIGMKVDDEMFVRGHRVKASAVTRIARGDAGQVFTEKLFYSCEVGVVAFAGRVQRVKDLLSSGVFGDFKQSILRGGKAVEECVSDFVGEPGASPIQSICLIVDFEPMHMFSQDAQSNVERAKPFAGPRPGGEDEAVGGIRGPLGFHFDPALSTMPPGHGLPGSEFRATPDGLFEVGEHALLDAKKSRIGLHDGVPSGRDDKMGKPFCRRPGVDGLDGQAVRIRDLSNRIRDTLIALAYVNDTRAEEQVLAPPFRQFIP
jgi:hypothetical protein